MEALLKYSDTRSPVTGEPSTLGLACTLSGLSLAGAPLLHRTAKGFDVRPGDQVVELLKCAYGGGADLGGLAATLNLVAGALNRGDLEGAKAATALLNLDELDWTRAVSLAQVEYQLKKYDQSELRDRRGRWATAGSNSAVSRKPNPNHSVPHPRAGPLGVMGSTPVRLAIAEEVVGGGPEDPAADVIAAATLAAGFLVSLIAENRRRSGGAAPRNRRRSSSRSQALSNNHDEDECDELLSKDSINCQIVKSIKGARKGAQCRSVAMTRYGECLKGGISSVRTPFYWGN